MPAQARRGTFAIGPRRLLRVAAATFPGAYTAIRDDFSGAATLLGCKRLQRDQPGYQTDQKCVAEASEVAHEQVHADGILTGQIEILTL